MTATTERALVTGATGMIGAALCADLVADGVDVIALVLDDEPRSDLYRSGTAATVEVVRGDLADRRAVTRAVVSHEVDTVFHLGAQTIVGAARRDPVATYLANVAGTWNVLEACRLYPDLVRRVVVASSDKAYGTVATLPYTEDMPVGGIEPYEVSKACADLVTQSYAHSYGVPAAVARCGNVYGPGDLNWSRLVPGTARSLLLGRRPVLRSNGSHVRDYIHVADVVAAYRVVAAAIDSGTDVAGEAFNFSDESPRTVSEVYEAVCRAADREGVEPEILDRTPGEIPSQHLSAAKARRVLGWKPQVGLDEGLRGTVAWYRDLLATP